eukprot:3699537-Amphidinium_carterae.1
MGPGSYALYTVPCYVISHVASGNHVIACGVRLASVLIGIQGVEVLGGALGVADVVKSFIPSVLDADAEWKLLILIIGRSGCLNCACVSGGGGGAAGPQCSPREDPLAEAVRRRAATRSIFVVGKSGPMDPESFSMISQCLMEGFMPVLQVGAFPPVN